MIAFLPIQCRHQQGHFLHATTDKVWGVIAERRRRGRERRNRGKVEGRRRAPVE